MLHRTGGHHPPKDGRFISLFPPGTPPARMATLLREQLAAPRP
jgi:hypothetical protein